MNKVAFITGASSGIGQSIVESLKNIGWDVIMPTHAELDLNNLQDIDKYIENLRTTKIDAFIHVAGIWHNNESVLANISFGEYSSDQIINSMNVGITSVMLLINKLIPKMSNTTIIGISGTFSEGAKGWLPYYTSKRAFEDFLVGLSQDNHNLKTYGISPADTATKAYEKFYHEYISEAQDPKNISDLVMKLLNENNYESGSIIEVRNGNERIAFHA